MEHKLHIISPLLKLITVLLLTLLISSCAKLNSIYRSQPIPSKSPHLVSIDAKQRVVLSNSVKEKKGNNPDIVRFCVEPSPDVFTAIASSLGAEASFSQTSTKDIAAKLASTISENAATIERTQTINILREAMYRNCERYLSGAIGKEEFIIQAARDQQLIIQVLAVEQITGVAKTQSTALTTVAKSAAGGVSDTSLATLTSAKKDVDTKRVSKTTVINDAHALPPKGQCSTSPIDETNPPNGLTADQAKTKNAKCAEVTKSVQLLKEAEEHYTLVKQTVAKQGSVSSETLGQLATAASTASEASVEIAQKVVQIVQQYQAFDEIGMTCVVKLRTGNNLPPYCTYLLQQMATKQAAQLRRQTEQIDLESEQINAEKVKMIRTALHTATRSNAEIVWNKLDQNITPINLQALAKKAGFSIPASRIKQLIKVKADFSNFIIFFKSLPTDQQSDLAKAAKQP